MWKSTKIILSASILYPNKLCGKIEVGPINATDLIDHFELYVDDVARKVNLAPTDVKGRGRVRTVIGPPYNFQKKAYPQMQNLMANLLVINSTHFENNLMISSTDY